MLDSSCTRWTSVTGPTKLSCPRKNVSRVCQNSHLVVALWSCHRSTFCHFRCQQICRDNVRKHRLHRGDFDNHCGVRKIFPATEADGARQDDCGWGRSDVDMASDGVTVHRAFCCSPSLRPIGALLHLRIRILNSNVTFSISHSNGTWSYRSICYLLRLFLVECSKLMLFVKPSDKGVIYSWCRRTSVCYSSFFSSWNFWFFLENIALHHSA